MIEEMWGREGLEGRRAEEKGRRREEWRPGGSTWRAEYHVTTGQKNGKEERRTCRGTTIKAGKREREKKREESKGGEKEDQEGEDEEGIGE